jgi:hypothetical protein
MPEAGLNRTNMIMVAKHHKRNDRQEVSRLVRPVPHSRHPAYTRSPRRRPTLATVSAVDYCRDRLQRCSASTIARKSMPPSRSRLRVPTRM